MKKAYLSLCAVCIISLAALTTVTYSLAKDSPSPLAYGLPIVPQTLAYGQ